MPWRSPSKLTFDANRAEQAHSARHVLAVEVSARHGRWRVRSWRSFCRASYCPSRLKVTHDVALLRDFVAMHHGLTNARSVRN